MQAETWHIIVQAEIRHIIVQAETYHIIVQAETYHIIVQAETCHIIVQAKAWHVIVQAETCEIIMQDNVCDIIVETETNICSCLSFDENVTDCYFRQIGKSRLKPKEDAKAEINLDIYYKWIHIKIKSIFCQA